MPIENRMERPSFFIAWNGVSQRISLIDKFHSCFQFSTTGVLNSSCLTVLAIFGVAGFYGYLVRAV
jgi:hypothetical protein